LYFNLKIAFSRTSHVLYFMESPKISEPMDICNIVMNFEEVSSFPDQASARHWIRCQYLMSGFSKYLSPLSYDVQIRINSATCRTTVRVHYQNGV
jgi:hypothetical protein